MKETPHQPTTPARALNLAAAGRVFAALHTDDESLASDTLDELPRIAGYTLTERLGGGGGGVVYKGYRDGSERALAVKLLNCHPREHDTGQRRAWRELELLSHVRLPSVPRVIDYGLTSGRLFIATEFTQGVALDKLCARQTLSVREKTEVLARVADAVHSLHEQGVIHRDIKPSNVLIDVNLQPVIIDLGIATLLTADAMETLTAEGAPLGSLAFMAPEQARGERDRISTRTDVYALGATSLLVLTGKTPHDTDSTLHEVLRRVAQEPPRRARTIDPSLPRPLAAVLDKATAARPEDRYSSAAALAADLRRWLAGEPVLAEEPGVWTRTGHWIGRHPAVATLAACLSIAVMVIGGTALSTWWLSIRPDQVRVSADGRDAELVSAGGRVLSRWEGRLWGELVFAETVDRPESLGGGRMALIGFTNQNPPRGDARLTGLCAFSFDTPRTPLWSSGSAPPDFQMPPHPNFTAPQQFVLDTSYVLADIFPQVPGLEIVAVHLHTQWSPTAIRVYDLSGNVRYEAWHDGYIESLFWSPDRGLLLCAGVNSEVLWRGRGHAERKAFPVVLMALRPRDGTRPGWITAASSGRDDSVAWYKCLLPPDTAELLHDSGLSRGCALTSAAGNDTSRCNLLLNVTGGPAGGGPYVQVTISADGEILSVARSAEYVQRAGTGSALPDPDSLFLGDLPPVIPGGEAFRPANK